MKCLRRRSIRHLFILVAILLVLIILIDNQSELVWNLHGNYYTAVVHQSITRVRNNDMKIGIAVVLDDRRNVKAYPLAHLTVSCYAQLFSYELIVIEFAGNADLQKLCPQNDFMFRRHCAIVDLLRRRKDLDYIIFLDADIGVVNPNHLIEDYITTAELTFYQRIFNYEIMAGAYIAKRSDFAINFLEQWANYSTKLPSSFHGTDNGAIHNVFLDVECGDPSPPPHQLEACKNRVLCTRLWNASQDYDDLELFTSCARSILGDRNLFANGQIYLMTNRSRDVYFVRDGWLTGNEWSEGDFLLHGWQKRRLDKWTFAGWHAPLVPDIPYQTAIDIERATEKFCTSREAASEHVWAYKNTFVKSSAEIYHKIEEIVRMTYSNHAKNLRKISYF